MARNADTISRMGGALRIGDQRSWVPAGWVFRNVLEGMAPDVERHDASLAARMRDAVEGFNYLSISDWSATEFSWFLEAAIAEQERQERAGPQSFHKPEFYPGFMERLRELVELLKQDGRAQEP